MQLSDGVEDGIHSLVASLATLSVVLAKLRRLRKQLERVERSERGTDTHGPLGDDDRDFSAHGQVSVDGEHGRLEIELQGGPLTDNDG